MAADSSNVLSATSGSSPDFGAELLDNLPVPALLLDAREWTIEGANSAAGRLYGKPASEIKALGDLCTPEETQELRQFLENVSSNLMPRTWTCLRCDGSRLSLEISCSRIGGPTSPKRLLLATDITDRLRTERQASIFSALGHELSGSRSPREAARAVASAAEELFGWDACMLEQCATGSRTTELVLGMDTVDGKRMEVTTSAGRPGPIAQQALSGGPQLILRSGNEPPETGSMPFGDTSRLSKSIMAVPLMRHGRPIGVFSIHSYSTRAYKDSDLNTLIALAEHCSGAFSRLRAEDEIAGLHGELRRHLEELQTLFAVAPVGIAVAHDVRGKKVTLNAACAEVLGLPPGTSVLEEVEGRPWPFRISKDGQELTMRELPMSHAAMTGQPVRLAEFEVHRADGTTVHCLAGASPLFDDVSKIRGSLGVLLDITERKTAEAEILRLNAELEGRVKERTRQLELANRELESFSYSVSHDLRAPLRSIRGFSEVLLDRYSSQLDARGQEFLKRACDSCSHMDRLIEDLLKLSRVNRSELQPTRVDLTAMAHSILEEICKSDLERKVDVHVSPELQASADERLLRLALENLLRNAWKFTRKQPEARIEIGRLETPENVFYVRDNGAGFDMAYAGKLFGVFQRLHSSSEFPGTGIGLATVQRVIRRHGGRVWAEGAVNQGATFYFTLSEPGSA